MNKTIQTILLVVAFLLSAALGYFIVGKLGKGNVEPMESTVEEETTVVETPVSSSGPRVLEVDVPSYHQNTGLYSFQARGDGNDIVFYLADEKGDIIKSSAQHTTVAVYEVAPTASGVYYVCAVDADNNRSEMVKVEGCKVKAVAVVNKVSAADLFSLLSSKDTQRARKELDGRIAPSCKFICSGLSEDEDPPTSYVEIISRLKRSWESITISSVDYDAQGRIKSVNMAVTQKQQ